MLVLLDNAHAPDRRAQWLSGIMRGAGAEVRIVAWDRRTEPITVADPEPGEEIIRIAAPAALGAGARTLGALARFNAAALRRRRELLAGVDAVIASDIYLLPLGRLFAAQARRPLVYEAREDWAALEAERWPAAMRAVVTRAETAVARAAVAVVVPGVSRTRRWQRVGVEPIVLRNVGLSALRRAELRWDVASVGLMVGERRPDLLLELAACRPDLRIVLGGSGRLEPWVRRQAARLPNVDYLGWVDDVDEVLAASAVVLYGQDPGTAYSSLACPNTLYQAVRVGRPLVFYCGGEPLETVRRFRIGLRCAPAVDQLAAAVDAVREHDDWEFDAAWQWLRDGAEQSFVKELDRLLQPGRARSALVSPGGAAA
jgi:glycosyltransferase involved in cell wall biosynthesis